MPARGRSTADGAAADQRLRPAHADQGRTPDLHRRVAARRARGPALRGVEWRAAARPQLCRRCGRGAVAGGGDDGNRGRRVQRRRRPRREPQGARGHAGGGAGRRRLRAARVSARAQAHRHRRLSYRRRAVPACQRMGAAPIPQTDPKAAYLAQRREIDVALARVLQGGRYILGAEVAAFERAFAAYIGVRHALGVANGTDALVLALRALGIGAPDYVVTVAHTAVATVAAIELAGAKPLLIDIDPATYTMDAAELSRVLDAPPGRIGAVIPVHLYGQPADLDAILPLARRHRVPVIEDCAQCHGAALAGRRLGSVGDVAAFSFYPTKNLGALGDGGAVVTGDDALAERVRALREYGWRQRYVSDIAGTNSRLDELQAAILGVKLAALDADNARRAAIADAYDAGLAGLPLGLPARRPGAR